MKKITIFLISAFVFVNYAYSQELSNAILQETKKSNYEVFKSNYFKFASENMPSLTKDQVSKLLRYKLNLKSAEEINKLIDDDIVNIVLHRNQDYKSKAVLRPQVIMGTVVSQTYDTRRESFFHTEWAVRIDEIIADDGNVISKFSEKGEDVYIKSMTGMIGDRYRNITHTKKLFIGEKVLLFIAPMRNLGKRRSLNEREMLKNFNISSIENLDKTFSITGGYTIKFDNVYNMDGRHLGALDEVKKITQQIIDINNQARFEEDFKRGSK